MGYWDETDLYLRRHGGGPKCPSCGQTMFPADDHGRFKCFCRLGSTFDTVTGLYEQAQKIPQVDTAGMTNEEKAKIPPINRLEATPTAAEAKLLALSARGPDCMEDQEYFKACEELEEEREQKK